MGYTYDYFVLYSQKQDYILWIMADMYVDPKFFTGQRYPFKFSCNELDFPDWKYLCILEKKKRKLQKWERHNPLKV